ncbi:putative HTH-type transcriptional regulator YdfH [Botrimarina colliarenosi]|uniref:Putative HTH-type transcriptional regulator YdfH n=1 Tax=Botrimarina colliarenosi TaxID=2528001 RepID=A0A5C6AE61_9BACT|nr:GntR family transcriptional regulator [Botrimarina colliarenosi]TWT97697.1 putative HTH-type transcriptional regulator YdfH [Botrimarina colliarenosi]
MSSTLHKRPNRTSQAYFSLRDKITSGMLVPGQVVSEASLAKELGISRTPIGEALRRLAHEGLVEQVPRYGTIVRQFSTTELIELFEIREALEGMAAMKAAERISTDALAELAHLHQTIEDEMAKAESASVELVEGESLSKFLSADIAFHMLIIASTGNRRLMEMTENTRSIASTFNAKCGNLYSVQRIRTANAGHKGILDALVRRDGAEAQRLIVEHIRSWREQSLRQRERRDPVTLGTINLPDFVRQDLDRDRLTATP